MPAYLFEPQFGKACHCQVSTIQDGVSIPTVNATFPPAEEQLQQHVDSWGSTGRFLIREIKVHFALLQLRSVY